MSIAGYQASNHPHQVAARGAVDQVDDRATPPENFDPLHERYHFTLDVAAAAHNTKCPRYFHRDLNGLEQPWAGERVWCNPPFSDLRSWVSKAWAEWTSPEPPALIVMLLPSNRTEQGWWQELVEPHRDRPGTDFRVKFLPGRMRFLYPPGVQAPKHNRPLFGCCLLIWDAEA